MKQNLKERLREGAADAFTSLLLFNLPVVCWLMIVVGMGGEWHCLVAAATLVGLWIQVLSGRDDLERLKGRLERLRERDP